jgi:hypothetical protein
MKRRRNDERLKLERPRRGRVHGCDDEPDGHRLHSNQRDINQCATTSRNGSAVLQPPVSRAGSTSQRRNLRTRAANVIHFHSSESHRTQVDHPLVIGTRVGRIQAERSVVGVVHNVRLCTQRRPPWNRRSVRPTCSVSAAQNHIYDPRPWRAMPLLAPSPTGAHHAIASPCRSAWPRCHQPILDGRNQVIPAPYSSRYASRTDPPTF